MPVLLLLLALIVLAYFIWRAKSTTLTRNCRWRQSRSEGLWRCAYCAAVSQGSDQPRHCHVKHRN